MPGLLSMSLTAGIEGNLKYFNLDRDLLSWDWTFAYIYHMDVSENNGTPKSSILIGIAI